MKMIILPRRTRREEVLVVHIRGFIIESFMKIERERDV